ncbi:MAG: DUF5683 domain-containing protein [Pseudomonadota bacterium]|nr:DUF5683 domain-containing protein [Pseudomonadota bacterium]
MYPNKMLIVILFLITIIFVPELCLSQNSSQSDSNKADGNSFGYLSVKTDVDSFYVSIDDNFNNVYHITSNDTLTISSGEHRIRLIKKNYRDLITTMNIKPDTINVLSTSLLPFRNFKYHKYFSSYPRIFWGAPIIIKSDPDANLYVNDEFVGTGIAKIDTVGNYTIQSILPSGQSTSSNIRIGDNNNSYHGNIFQVKEIYNRPLKKKSRYMALLPGASQLYQKDRLKGYLIIGATLISGGLAIKYQKDFSEKNNLFKSTRSSYESATNPEDALRLGELTRRQLKDANYAADKRDFMIYASLGIYLYNLIDSFLKPNTGYRTKIGIDPYIDFDEFSSSTKGISLSYNF